MEKKAQAEAQLAAAVSKLNRIRVRDSVSEKVLHEAESNLQRLKVIIEGEAGPVIPPPPPPSSEFAPDIFLGDSASKYPSGSIQPNQPKGSATLVSAPDGSSDKVWELKVANEGWSSSDNPRSQLLSTGISNTQLQKGIWWGGAFWLPNDFPASSPGWWNLAEFYGQPFDGSPTVEIDLRSNGVGWQRNSEGSFKEVWRQPYVRGKKNTFLMHLESEHVEMWLNGSQVCSIDLKVVGTPNRTGPQQAIIQSYRQYNSVKSIVTMFHWPCAVGTQRGLVEYF